MTKFSLAQLNAFSINLSFKKIMQFIFNLTKIVKKIVKKEIPFAEDSMTKCKRMVSVSRIGMTGIHSKKIKLSRRRIYNHNIIHVMEIQDRTNKPIMCLQHCCADAE